jgi:hypothetical protein
LKPLFLSTGNPFGSSRKNHRASATRFERPATPANLECGGLTPLFLSTANPFVSSRKNHRASATRLERTAAPAIIIKKRYLECGGLKPLFLSTGNPFVSSRKNHRASATRFRRPAAPAMNIKKRRQAAALQIESYRVRPSQPFSFPVRTPPASGNAARPTIRVPPSPSRAVFPVW